MGSASPHLSVREYKSASELTGSVIGGAAQVVTGTAVELAEERGNGDGKRKLGTFLAQMKDADGVIEKKKKKEPLYLFDDSQVCTHQPPPSRRRRRRRGPPS